jgi:alginate O-acetyltransferase complex protein AlgI
MVFASLIFLFLFLPLNLLLYYSTKNATWRNWVLIVFSLAFMVGENRSGFPY